MFRRIYILLSICSTVLFAENLQNNEDDSINCTNCYEPIADAGEDQIFYKGSTVTLDASNSYDPEGGSITYHWFAPSGIVLSDSTAMNPTFSAPDVLVDTDYIITLIVNDGNYNSLEDNVIITVAAVNTAPFVSLSSSLTVNKNAVFEIDASSAADTTLNGVALSFAWDSPDFSPTTSTESIVSFTAPSVNSDTSYDIALTIDDSVNSSVYIITVTVKSNVFPVAIPGILIDGNLEAEGEFGIGSEFTLDGSASYDPDSSGELSYTWSFGAGCTFDVVSGSLDSAVVTLKIPANQAPGDCPISLVVNDASDDSVILPPSDLFISEYVEASSSANSYLEIYNGTDSAIDLSDYYIEIARASGGQVNDWGASNNYESGPLSGSLNSGQILIIARSSNADLFDNDGFNVADVLILYSDGASGFEGGGFDDIIQRMSGDEGVGLFKISTNSLIDVVGRVPGVDPGSGWQVGTEDAGTKDHTLVRSQIVNSGNSNWSALNDGSCNDDQNNILSDEYGCAQWDVYNSNTYDYGGWHFCAICNNEVIVTVTDNQAPVANAGDDFVGVAGYTVSVDGSLSSDVESPDDLIYSWSTNDNIVIINSSSVIASFVVPDTPDVYSLNLTVTDPGGAQDTDQILITAVNVNSAPTPVVLISDQAYDSDFDGTLESVGYSGEAYEGHTIYLDASNTIDATSTGQILYDWDAPQGIVLSDSTIANPTFVVPEYVGTYTSVTFTLNVSDSDLQDSEDITVNLFARWPIISVDSDTHTDFEDELIKFDASSTTDDDDSIDDLTFIWSAPSSGDIYGVCYSSVLGAYSEDTPCSSISDCGALDTECDDNYYIAYGKTPSHIGNDAEYIYEVQAFDGDNAAPSALCPGSTSGFCSEVQEINVSVTARFPISDAGSDIDALVGNIVTLNAVLSEDPQEAEILYEYWDTDGDFEDKDVNLIAFYDNGSLNPLPGYVFTWSVAPTNGTPNGSLIESSSLSNINAVMPTFTPDVVGDYRFNLSIEDPDGFVSESDQIKITVVENDDPVADAGSDARVLSESVFVLDGRRSFDDTDTGILNYTWISLDSNELTILNSDESVAMFTAPFVDFGQDSTMTFELAITDGSGGEDKDTLSVVVANYSRPISPSLYGVAEHEKITLYWDNVAESAIDSLTLYSDFQGYRIYKSQDYGETWGPADSLVFDSNTGDTLGWKAYQIYDLSEDADTSLCLYKYDFLDCEKTRGKEISGADPYRSWFNLGSNTGLSQTFVDTNVVDGIDYTYTITAYDRGIQPDTLEYGSYGDGDEDFGGDDETWYSGIPDHTFNEIMEANYYNQKKLDYTVQTSYIDSLSSLHMYALSIPAGLTDGKDLWSVKSNYPSTNPDGYGYYTLENGNLIGFCTTTGGDDDCSAGSRSLESARGTSVNDHNYVQLTAGYLASDVSFPDLQDLDEFISSDCRAVGNGDKFYEVVSYDDLTTGLVKLEIEADLGNESFENYQMEDARLYAYPVMKIEEENKPAYYRPVDQNNFELVQPVALQEANDGSLYIETEGDFDELSELPGYVIDLEDSTVIIPDYYNISTESNGEVYHSLQYIDDPGFSNNWTNFFGGVRMRFDNALRKLRTDQTAELSEVYSYPDSGLVTDVFLNEYLSGELELQYYSTAGFGQKPNYEYEVELSDSYLDTAVVTSSNCPTSFKTLLPFKVKNLTTGKYVKLQHSDNGIWGGNTTAPPASFPTPNDPTSHYGYGDCVWQPGEVITFVADTVLVGDSEVPSASATFSLNMNYDPVIIKYIPSDPCSDYVDFDKTTDYSVGSCVYDEGMVWYANEDAPSIILDSSVSPPLYYSPNYWDDQNGDNVNDNPWTPVYLWSGSSSYHSENNKIVLKPKKWFVDGDYWIADMSALGRQKTLEEKDLAEINVVPNPYIVGSEFQEQSGSRLRFIHLPAKCTITIYTISGEYVDVINHDSSYDGSEWWDLKNESGRSVAPGLYIYRVETENEIDFIGKFAIVR